MNIKKSREFIIKNKGKVFLFRYKGCRNQVDEFVGKILEFYNYVFIVKVSGKYGIVKSFSYNDILTGNLEIKEVVIKK